MIVMTKPFVPKSLQAGLTSTAAFDGPIDMTDIDALDEAWGRKRKTGAPKGTKQVSAQKLYDDFDEILDDPPD